MDCKQRGENINMHDESRDCIYCTQTHSEHARALLEKESLVLRVFCSLSDVASSALGLSRSLAPQPFRVFRSVVYVLCLRVAGCSAHLFGSETRPKDEEDRPTRRNRNRSDQQQRQASTRTHRGGPTKRRERAGREKRNGTRNEILTRTNV